MKIKKYVKIVFFLYLLVVIKVVVFKYPYEQLLMIVSNWEKDVIWEGLHTANFTLFRTINMYIRYADSLNSFENLVGNTVVLIPFGFLLPYVLRHGKNFIVMMLHTLVFVVGIELFQLLSAFGAFDVDDILLNSIGAILGWILYWIWEAIKGHEVTESVVERDTKRELKRDIAGDSDKNLKKDLTRDMQRTSERVSKRI